MSQWKWHTNSNMRQTRHFRLNALSNDPWQGRRNGREGERLRHSPWSETTQNQFRILCDWIDCDRSAHHEKFRRTLLRPWSMQNWILRTNYYYSISSISSHVPSAVKSAFSIDIVVIHASHASICYTNRILWIIDDGGSCVYVINDVIHYTYIVFPCKYTESIQPSAYQPYDRVVLLHLFLFDFIELYGSFHVQPVAIVNTHTDTIGYLLARMCIGDSLS